MPSKLNERALLAFFLKNHYKDKRGWLYKKAIKQKALLSKALKELLVLLSFPLSVQSARDRNRRNAQELFLNRRPSSAG